MGKKMDHREQMQKVKQQRIKDFYYVSVCMYKQEAILNTKMNSNGAKKSNPQQKQPATPSENYNRITEFLNRWIKAEIIDEGIFSDLANRSLESYNDDISIDDEKVFDYSNSSANSNTTTTDLIAVVGSSNTMVVVH